MNIADICTREVVFADRGDSLRQAASLMREHHVGTLLVTSSSADGLQVRRLLVSGEGGRVYGVVSLDDVLGAVAHEMAELASAVRKGVEREAHERAPLVSAPQLRAVRIPDYALA